MCLSRVCGKSGNEIRSKTENNIDPKPNGQTDMTHIACTRWWYLYHTKWSNVLYNLIYVLYDKTWIFVVEDHGRYDYVNFDVRHDSKTGPDSLIFFVDFLCEFAYCVQYFFRILGLIITWRIFRSEHIVNTNQSCEGFGAFLSTTRFYIQCSDHTLGEYRCLEIGFMFICGQKLLILLLKSFVC